MLRLLLQHFEHDTNRETLGGALIALHQAGVDWDNTMALYHDALDAGLLAFNEHNAIYLTDAGRDYLNETSPAAPDDPYT